MKLPNFENWSSGKLSKIGKHFIKIKWFKCYLKISITKNVKFWHLPIKLQDSMTSFDYSWFIAKNLSNFVSLPWKLHNRYCHTLKALAAGSWHSIAHFVSATPDWWRPWLRPPQPANMSKDWRGLTFGRAPSSFFSVERFSSLAELFLPLPKKKQWVKL